MGFILSNKSAVYLKSVMSIFSIIYILLTCLILFIVLFSLHFVQTLHFFFNLSNTFVSVTIINDVTFYFVEVLSQVCLKRFFEAPLLSKSLQENSSLCGTSRHTYATRIHMRTRVLWNIDTPKSIRRKVFCWGELKPRSDGFTEIVQGLHVQAGGNIF